MDKCIYITNLFNNIKNNIEFDSDIIAINTILNTMLKIDLNKSIKSWKYVLKRYNIKLLSKDMDFTPILKDYPTHLLEEIGLQNFLDLINSFKKEHLEYLHNNLFNIYLEECGLFTALSKIIITGDKKREREFIDIAIKEYKSYPLGIFDPADFIHRVIIFHLQNNLKDISFLLTLAEIPRSKKDQALLKTLLIDYI